MLMHLRRLPLPSPSIIRKLNNASRQAWLDGFTSLVYAHLGTGAETQFPLWVISFWQEVVDLRSNARKRWLGAKDWLIKEGQRKKSLERRSLAEDACRLLDLLPWGKGKAGLADGQSISADMWRYLGTHWLSSTTQDDMLALLRFEASRSQQPKIIIEGVNFTTKLMEAYETRDTPAYQTREDFSWVRTIGKELVEKRATLLTEVHLGMHSNKPHWVAVVVDAKRNKLMYGDSYQKDIPAGLLNTYRWWLAQHTLQHFSNEVLPIGKQTDSHSCGLFADNALAHYLDSEKYPLIVRGEALDACLKMFVRLAEHILERVSGNMLASICSTHKAWYSLDSCRESKLSPL